VHIRNRFMLALALSSGLLQSPTVVAATLDAVRARGTLACAIHPGQPGMSFIDRQGQWRGFFVDYCRALAAAVLGNADKLRLLPTTSNKRFTVLQTGEVDVLSRTTSWTFTRDTGLGLNFAGVLYYDGQSFLVRKDSGVASSTDLRDATICIIKGTTGELNTADYFASRRIEFRSLVFENPDEAKIAFFARRCDALTTDALTLTIVRQADVEKPDEYTVLTELISKEPLGPVVRGDDDQWFDINKWLLNALLAAEEFGITASNVDEARSSTLNPEVRRLLGAQPGIGKPLGLDDEWAYRAIKAVGNYGEIYRRYITPLGVERGPNRLYRDGGLMYPLPFR
jgi:general L-amino acid transport system substrate-binding protein